MRGRGDLSKAIALVAITGEIAKRRLGAAGRDSAAIKSRAAACIGGQARQGGCSADHAAEGGGARRIDGETEGAIHRAGKGHVAAAGRAEGCIRAESDWVIVNLGAGGGRHATIERGAAGHVEIRTKNGFVSDFRSKTPSKRPLIGVYAKS